jgi:hypothetical protein
VCNRNVLALEADNENFIAPPPHCLCVRCAPDEVRLWLYHFPVLPLAVAADAFPFVGWDCDFTTNNSRIAKPVADSSQCSYRKMHPSSKSRTRRSGISRIG